MQTRRDIPITVEDRG